MNTGFWRGKRVLLTGHTGFKGGWLSLWLQSVGAEVTGLAQPPSTRPTLFEVACVWQGMHSRIGDIRDFNVLLGVVQAVRPEIVFHLAAQPLVRYSYENPVETYATNVMGTVHLFEAVRQTPGVRVLVNITSDKCYENKEWVWAYRENEPMGGYDPYSNSKSCAELVTSAYRNSFFSPAHHAEHGVAMASARAGNVIGGGDWAPDRLVPDILRAIEQGQPVLIRNPHATRPWQHVLEPLSGYLMLAENLYTAGPKFAEGWNFGPREEDARTVQWVVEKLTQLWGDGVSWQRDSNPHPHEAVYLKLDISKARTLLGWKPRWSLDRALEKIIQWHKAQRQGADMREMMLAQIEDYESTTPNQ